MSDAITVDVSDWTEFARLLMSPKARKLLEKHMHNAMDGSLDVAVGALAAETPVNTGALRDAWTKQIFGTSFNMTGLALNPLPYGVPVDQGRRAVQHPSRAAITAISLWVKRKGLASDPAEINSIAWAIARSPTEAAHIVDKAFPTIEAKIPAIWAYELEQYLEALARE
jgi:hypothetical protein